MPTYTIPPDTRAVGTGNPPSDVNQLADVAGLIAAILAQQAGQPASSVPADNATNITTIEGWLNGSYTGPGLAPTNDDTGVKDTANINGLMAFVPVGGLLQLQAGVFWTNAPVIQTPWINAQGYGVILNNSFLSDNPTIIKPVAGWAQGSAAVAAAWLIVDQTTGDYAIPSAGQQIVGINIDGSDAPTDVDGIDVYGDVGGVQMSYCSVQSATGGGFNFLSRAGNIPDGLRLTGLMAARCTGNNFFFQVADMVAHDLHAIGSAAGDGFRIITAANSHFSDCRSGNNAGKGWNFGNGTGSANPTGYISMQNCNSQLNTEDGYYVNWTSGNGGQVLNMTGCTSIGDGNNGGSGGGSFGALTIVQATAPILMDNFVVMSNTSGGDCPQYAVKATNCAYLLIRSGMLQAYSTVFYDGGGNGTILIDPAVLTGTGSPTSPTWNNPLLPLFGDGSDGVVTLDGSTAYTGWSSLTGDVYTMTRDVYATSIVVENGVTLKPGAYRIFCQGAVIINTGGEIACNGNNGGAGGATTPGSAGGAIAAETNAGGRPGGAGSVTAGFNASVSGLYAIGGSGGNGGAGTDAAGSGATASTVFSGWYKNPIYLLMGSLTYQTSVLPLAGGAGGGGGGGNGTAGGGGGGGGGGILVIFAWIVINNGTLSATGGAGGAAYATGDTGGGGGGGGGFILAYTVMPWTAGTTSVAPGALGDGGSTGNNGVAGSSGTVANVLVA